MKYLRQINLIMFFVLASFYFVSVYSLITTHRQYGWTWKEKRIVGSEVFEETKTLLELQVTSSFICVLWFISGLNYWESRKYFLREKARVFDAKTFD